MARSARLRGHAERRGGVRAAQVFDDEYSAGAQGPGPGGRYLYFFLLGFCNLMFSFHFLLGGLNNVEHVRLN